MLTMCMKIISFNTCNNGKCCFTLNYKKEDPKMPGYYLSHFICLNKRIEAKPEIESLMESLLKDTILIGDLKYAIRVTPYAG